MHFLLILLLFSIIYGEEYLSYAELNTKMKMYVTLFNSENNPHIHSKSMIIGKSTEMKDMIAYCYGNCEKGTSSFLLMGGIHGREGLSVMSSLHFVNHLYQQFRDKNAEISSLLLSTMIWIIPCMNPDAYDLNIREYYNAMPHRIKGMYGNYRKNRRETCPQAMHRKKSYDHGIDLNRNFPVCFDIDEEGSSGNPCSDIYRGPSPFSEKETQAFRSFLERLSFKPTIAMSLHGYGRSLLYPYSCKALGLKLNQTVINRFDNAVQDILHGISAKYLTGQAWKVPDLYTVNGDIADYLFSTFSIPAFNVELPPNYPQPSGQKGFWPAYEPFQKEINQLLWNTARLSGCVWKRTNDGIQNRGYGSCRIFLKEQLLTVERMIGMRCRIALQLIPVSDTLDVLSADQSFHVVWNPEQAQFEYQGNKETVKPTEKSIFKPTKQLAVQRTERLKLRPTEKQIMIQQTEKTFKPTLNPTPSNTPPFVIHQKQSFLPANMQEIARRFIAIQFSIDLVIIVLCYIFYHYNRINK